MLLTHPLAFLPSANCCSACGLWTSTLNMSWQHTAPVLIGLMQNDNTFRIASQRGWGGHGLCSPIALELKPDCAYGPVTLGNTLNFSEPQCSHLSYGSSSTNSSNWHWFPVHQLIVTDKWGNLYKPCSTWHIAGLLDKGLSYLIFLWSINLHHKFWAVTTSLQSIAIANAYRCPFIKGGSLRWVEEWVSRGKANLQSKNLLTHHILLLHT